MQIKCDERLPVVAEEEMLKNITKSTYMKM